MEITEQNFPVLYKGFRFIYLDNNMIPRGAPTCFTARENFSDGDLNLAELALKELSEDTFEEFCIGDQDAITELKKNSLGLRIADQLFDEYFGGGPY